jgi:predicted AlkP superfamily pyrophosphatase or phosphodiesterase
MYFTGSVPAIHGIAGNFWWDNAEQRNVYCTEDKTVQTVGSCNEYGITKSQEFIGNNDMR